jgi:ArsR family transcriptional regulator, arsenate/arsenite/antimonite-responsive transcriptional repressor
MATPIKQVARTFAKCAPLFQAMGEPARQKIIMLLAETERMNVTELATKIALSRPAISHHLKVLRQAKLVSLQRSGTESHYTLSIDAALTLVRRFVDEVEDCETDPS